MATGQVLFHRFYCKKSLAKFDVKVLVLLFSTLSLYLEAFELRNTVPVGPLV